MSDDDFTTLYANTQEYFQSCGCQDVANVLQVWADSMARAQVKLVVSYTSDVVSVLRWLGIINQQRTPVHGQTPNSVQTYPKPGGKTVRVFGPDGRAVRDIDYGSQAHSGNDPEVHDWDWSSGESVRGTGRAPNPGDIPPGY